MKLLVLPVFGVLKMFSQITRLWVARIIMGLFKIVPIFGLLYYFVYITWFKSPSSVFKDGIFASSYQHWQEYLQCIEIMLLGLAVGALIIIILISLFKWASEELDNNDRITH